MVRFSDFDDNEYLLSLLEPIFHAYNDKLCENGEVDFNDMISRATDVVKEGKYGQKYRYVIMDEYQDMTKAQFNLIKAPRDQKDFDLFCVGDDWQSTYRFAGSNIGFVYDFKKYWGISETNKIETIYRFPEKLIETSGKFIMRNPNQIKKSTRSASSDEFHIIEVREYDEYKAIREIIDRLLLLTESSGAQLLGRYGFDEKIILKDSRIRADGNSNKFILSERTDLKIEFVTVHRSKGTQADHVIILNNKDDKMGFPSKVTDAPICRLFVDNDDNYLFSEERRLFYVALTRTKKSVCR